jgi:hypothetical protein
VKKLAYEGVAGRVVLAHDLVGDCNGSEFGLWLKLHPPDMINMVGTVLWGQDGLVSKKLDSYY